MNINYVDLEKPKLYFYYKNLYRDVCMTCFKIDDNVYDK